MKKGFTLVEIIIAVTLIVILGTRVSIGVYTVSKNNSEADNINNLFLEAANLFISTEVDDDGEIYKNSLTTTNVRGVQVPLQSLVEKGYVDENKLTELLELNELEDGNYYVLALNGGNSSNNYCDEGEVSLTLSWTITDTNPVYLCDKKNVEIQEVIKEVPVEIKSTLSILDYSKLKLDINKYAVSDTYYNNLTTKTNFTNTNNGIFPYSDDNTGKTYYYYRGAVNNYLQLGTKDGSPLKWRIMWLDATNSKMKLVLDEEVPVTLIKANGTTVTINKNDVVKKYHISTELNDNDSETSYYLYNPNEILDETETSTNVTLKKYTVTVDNAKIISESVFNNTIVNNNMINSIYMDTLKKWYNQTNLSSLGLVLSQNNFCKNLYTTMSSQDLTETYRPSNTFDCTYNSEATSTSSNTLYSSSVGFVTYGEAIRSGLINSETNTSIVSSGNYLLKNSVNIYPLVDNNTIYSNYDGNLRHDKHSFYYISNTKLGTGNFYTYFSGDNDDNFKTQYRFNVNGSVSSYYKNYSYQNNVTRLNITTITFVANTVKPAIVINVNGKSLTGSGTSTDPFILS